MRSIMKSGYRKRFLLPDFDGFNAGLLEWAGELNPLACELSVLGRLARYLQAIWKNYVLAVMA